VEAANPVFVITVVDMCLVGTHLLSLDLSAAAVENRLSPWGAFMGRARQTVWVSSSPLRRDVGSTDSLREQLLAGLKGGFG
jgi:hypothetical protein